MDKDTLMANEMTAIEVAIAVYVSFFVWDI